MRWQELRPDKGEAMVRSWPTTPSPIWTNMLLVTKGLYMLPGSFTSGSCKVLLQPLLLAVQPPECTKWASQESELAPFKSVCHLLLYWLRANHFLLEKKTFYFTYLWNGDNYAASKTLRVLERKSSSFSCCLEASCVISSHWPLLLPQCPLSPCHPSKPHI